MTKTIIGLIFIQSLLANIGAVLLIKHLYLYANLIRLDPLQINTYKQLEVPKTNDKKRVVFFGDSRALSWPSLALEEFEFINRGIGHQTSEQIRLRYDKHVAPLNADIIVLQLCINDLKVIPLKPELRKNIVVQCKNNLQHIIHLAQQQGTIVILSTVFPLGKVPLERKLIWSEEVAETIDEVNLFILAQKTNDVIIFDSFQLLISQENTIKPEYSRDLLHLNTDGYNLLNQQLSKLLHALP